MTRAADGFTLVEVLIALAVVAIALVAFVSAGAQNADYASYIHQRTIAQVVARNQLVKYQIAADWPDTGSHGGNVNMADAEWHWQARIKSTADSNVRRVDVRVYPVDRDSNRTDKDSIVLLSGFLTQHAKQDKHTDSNSRTRDRTSDDSA